MKKYIKYLLIIIFICFIAPQIALASWWNPLTWNIFSPQNTGSTTASTPVVQTTTNSPTVNVFSPPKQIKTSGCVANQVLQDSACTPGAVLTEDTTVICKTGYTKTVRDVPLTERKGVFAEYGIPYSQSSKYEVDHLISLELGGGNDISNLWTENSTITNGSLTKDKFENYLHSQVCGGKMTIQEAQKEISTNWLKYYQQDTKIKTKIGTQ